MPLIDRIEGFADELTAIRRDLHAHPEIGFEEVRTSGIVADKLTQWGIEVHRGLGGTGVIGVLKGKGSGGKRIGLRADMDALPMEENTNLKWRSTIPGRFHGCGHDGHTTMLLGTARYLAETRNFDGTVHFIFQPAEEGLGGARAMIKDGLFEKFPCDEIYGLHNATDLNHGELAVLPGPAMAGADFFDITINGSTDNRAPVADADTNTVKEDTAPNPVSGNVLTNDSDPDGNVLSVTNPGTFDLGHGTLVLNADGSYTFTLDNGNSAVHALNNGQTLTDTFTYNISDGHGGTESAKLDITINGTTDGGGGGGCTSVMSVPLSFQPCRSAHS